MRKTFLEKCINLRLCRVALVLLFLVPAISSLQANPSQNKTISGVVTSATDSEPLIGVSVQVRETATGGITRSGMRRNALLIRRSVQRWQAVWAAGIS